MNDKDEMDELLDAVQRASVSVSKAREKEAEKRREHDGVGASTEADDKDETGFSQA